MVAAPWRRGSLAALAATLLVVRQASAEPQQIAASLRSAEARQAAAAPSERSTQARQIPAEPSVRSVDLRLVAAEPSVPGVESNVLVAERTLPPLKLGAPPSSAMGSEKLGTVLGRVPTASWAMGCAAGVGLVVHALYQNASDRRRLRMQNCAEDCPDYRIDHYRETRERADVALRLSVFAAASALWLAYNDPQEALERMGQRKLPREKRGFRVKVKPERRGVWASVVAYF